MREIKFRGFHEYINGKTVITVKGKEKRGTWFYGSYCPYTWSFAGRRINEPQIIIHDENNENDGLWVEVVPETVGQFTGLKDKNGKEIYDGDILTTENGTFSNTGQGYVRIYKGGFVSFYGQDTFNRDCFDELYNVCDEREIIGNIYENPELLEDNNENNNN